MMITGYRRVSTKSPCRVCGKPDWCSTTKDQSISFCARSATNADRLSGKGWGIYYSDLGSHFGTRNVLSKRLRFHSAPTPLVSIDVRNKVYRKLIQLSPASRLCELSLGGETLIDQNCPEFCRYGILPKSVEDRHRLLRSLIRSFMKDDVGLPSFIGVPGFSRRPNKGLQLGSDFNYSSDLLLIPFLDSNGSIQACQMKSLDYIPSRSGKYLWLSSVRQPYGCGPGTPLHHEGAIGFQDKNPKTVLVTEGALKAAIAQKFLPDRYVIGNSGVATSHKEIVKAARRKELEIAFDADCFTNPHVARALASLIALRIREQQFLSYDNPIRILTWDRRFKGIDDALIADATLKDLEVQEWLRALTPECFEVASHQLSGLSILRIGG